MTDDGGIRKSLEPMADGSPDDGFEISRDLLSSEHQKMLSRVLFPDTHTDKVVMCRKERTLHPLPIKWDRKLHAATLPFATASEDAEKRTAKELDELLDKSLQDAVLVLCEAYGEDWYDVKQAVEKGDLLLKEMQAAVVVQQELQGQDNFLLTPLCAVINTMRAREILGVLALVRFGTASTGLMQLSGSVAPSQS